MILVFGENRTNYDAVVQLFAERYPRKTILVDPFFDESQNWNKIKCSIVIVLLMQICMFLRSFVIFLWKEMAF